MINKVIAIVVTYNRKKLLKECIDALINQDYKNCEIIIIDNASTDGTADMIEKEYPDTVFYYNTGRNLGGAGGFNYGIKKAYEQGCDYMWLMDDDCIVKSNSLSVLMEEVKKINNNFGFLSSRVLWKDGNLSNMNIPKKNYINKIKYSDKETIKIIMATFVSFLVRSNVVEDVGLPIKEFFIWADDLEYSRRISKKYPCYYVYDSVVLHKSKNNIGSNLAVDNADDLQRYLYAYRNEFFLYRNEGLVGKLYYWIKRMYHKTKIILTNKRRQEKLSVINNAIKEAKCFYPQIEYVGVKRK